MPAIDWEAPITPETWRGLYDELARLNEGLRRPPRYRTGWTSRCPGNGGPDRPSHYRQASGLSLCGKDVSHRQLGDSVGPAELCPECWGRRVELRGLGT